MAKQIAKLLKATIQDTSDLKQIAKTLAGKGRGGDSMLAHITPKEANILKAAGGAGTINPETGLLEFYDGEPFSMDYLKDYNVSGEGDFGTSPALRSAPVEQAPEYDWSKIKAASDFTPASTSRAGVPTREEFNRQFPGGAPQFTDAGYLGEPTLATQFTPGPFAGNLGLEIAARRQDDGTYRGTGFYPRGMRSTLDMAPVPENIARIPSQYALRPELPGVSETSAAAGGAPVAGTEAEKGYLQKLKERLTSPEALEKLGLAGIGAIPGVLQARQAAKEGRQAKQELQQLASPYQTEGKRLLEQAQRGELTAPAQQQIQALQARAAQGVASRGGVGAEQAAAQVEAFRQQLLANQYDLGMKVSGIGDQIATGAIKAGLQANAYVNELTAAYYNNMFRGLGATGQPQQQQTQPGR